MEKKYFEAKSDDTNAHIKLKKAELGENVALRRFKRAKIARTYQDKVYGGSDKKTKKEVKKIFRKFYQAGRFRENDMSGSGLGLYLVSSIAIIHGWRVSAASAGKGRGTTFTLTIPKASIANVREKSIWKKLKKSVSWS